MTDKWQFTLELKTRTVILQYVHKRTSHARDGVLRDLDNVAVKRRYLVPDLIRDLAVTKHTARSKEAPDQVPGRVSTSGQDGSMIGQAVD